MMKLIRIPINILYQWYSIAVLYRDLQTFIKFSFLLYFPYEFNEFYKTVQLQKLYHKITK